MDEDKKWIKVNETLAAPSGEKDSTKAVSIYASPEGTFSSADPTQGVYSK